jgi:serine/threonine protein kinase
VDAVAQMAEGLAHLHAQRLLHRDLAPRNVLVFGDGRVALTDFGLTREGEVGEELKTRSRGEQFPVRFAAPEVLQTARNEYFAASDVWMLALTAWQMLTGRLPFEDIVDHLEAAQAAAEGRARLNWDSLAEEAAPRELRALLAECCALRREERPSAAQVAQRARAIAAAMGPAPLAPAAAQLEGPERYQGVQQVAPRR